MSTVRTYAELATHVIRRLEEHGIAVPSTSRLHRMRGLFVDSDGMPKPIILPNDPEIELAQEAMRDFQHLGFIMDELTRVLTPAVLKTQLRTVIHDSALPQDDRTNSTGRDRQSELYVAAICAKAGMQPIFVEPDLQCRFNDGTWSLAVKRIKSANKFAHHIKKAVEQIENAALPGIVVADISLMLNPANARIVSTMPDGDFRHWWTEKLTSFVDTQIIVPIEQNGLEEWFAGTRAHGLILIDHHVRLVPASGWQLDSMAFNVDLSSEVGRAQDIATFFSVFERGLATTPTVK
jgi:hypothetical protein